MNNPTRLAVLSVLESVFGWTSSKIEDQTDLLKKIGTAYNKEYKEAKDAATSRVARQCVAIAFPDIFAKANQKKIVKLVQDHLDAMLDHRGHVQVSVDSDGEARIENIYKKHSQDRGMRHVIGVVGRRLLKHNRVVTTGQVADYAAILISMCEKDFKEKSVRVQTSNFIGSRKKKFDGFYSERGRLYLTN